MESQDTDAHPEVVITSPYRRALETARLATDVVEVELLHDERLRERDLGVFDGLTGLGIRTRYPDEAERRKKLGKFYYQPPSGESWCDVALRVRSLLLTWREEYAGRRVAVFTHQAVIMCHRLVLEDLSEEVLLEADRGDPLANCSMTTYRTGADGRLELVRYNDTSAVERSAEAPVTEEPDAESPDAEKSDVADVADAKEA
jgi:broad specificity phosphatase PhoE